MTEAKRLFDCTRYHLERLPIDDMLAAKEDGQWKKYSTKEVSELVDTLGAGLVNMGYGGGDGSVEGRDKIAVMSNNRPEWMLLDFASQQIGAVLVPIYPTISINELEFVLNDAAVKLVFVHDRDQFEKISYISDRIPSIQGIYTFNKIPGANHWKEILTKSTPQALAEVARIAESISPYDLATIIYTSGTTGTPKGVMLSHDNILSNVTASMKCLPIHVKRALSFLPLNHIFERMVSYIYLFSNISIYYAESLDTIADNLREVRPQIFTTVPRLLEKVYDRIMSKGMELTGMKRKLFYWAHDLALNYEINKNQGFAYRLQLSLANKLIFSKWREGLGGEIECIVSGGAACQVRLIRIFTAAGIPVLEGYGLTETSPVIAVNRHEIHDRKFGTVGPLLDNVQVKIAEDGEILCKGPNVMLGYYKQPGLTADVFQDGWYMTGDIGMMVDDRYLKITDRKKELFKTSGGKYVAPLPIENKLKESIYVEQAMIVGSEMKFVGALIVPSFSNLREWLRQNGVPFTNKEDVLGLPVVQNLYRELVESFNKFFNHVEQVKRFELLSEEWSVETGEMTPKMSLKRKVILEKYRHSINRIYHAE
ncbi:MAG: long-chain fatty acid--CoA ligase [Chitinophagaceae bacterium]